MTPLEVRLLHAAAREFGVDVGHGALDRLARFLEMRAEEAATDPELAGRAAVAISRALRLDVFLALAVPLLAPHGTAIAMQTPRTAGLARERALEHGFRLAARQDYALPGGAARALLFFDRGPPVS